MSTFTNTMFDSIKQALNNQSKSGGVSDILRTTAGNTYEVRLLPCVKNPAKTFYHYYAHGWTSFATGQYVNALSPQTWNERDPIAEIRYQHYRAGTPEEREKSRSIIRSEKWLVNAYVVNDPTDSDNNGKIKILRYGKQLHNILMDAIEGDDSDQFGPRIFDMSKNGCSLRIKVEKQGDYPSYVSSRFLMPSEVSGMTESRAKEIYDSIHDLEEVLPRKSQQELQQMVDEHYLCRDISSAPEEAIAPAAATASATASVAQETSDDVPWSFSSESDTSESVAKDTGDDSDVDDDTIKQLLDGLDDE